MKKTRRRGESTIQVGIRFPKQIKKAVTELAIRERRSLNDQIIYAVEQYMSSLGVL